ncbi:hypothetical protein D3869_09960 [Azospirillum brasilense]|uniref:Uncharacterized protein n=1 Tax=Azospirillum brasilense TaxID=192 RepID=A0A4D8QYV3_AZOBR|nr:hypothetical protein [Azospirillum brasilense]QCO15527.1 hypothetical protein D3869_09960 [Azospirillum brasilense]
MLNPGTYALADRAITTAINEAQSPIVDLEGMTAVTIQARLAYGSGGTTAKVYVATSLDNGLTWVDVACLAFGPAGGVKVVNVSGLTPKGIPVVPTDGALADDTTVDGVLGDRLRARIVTMGTYSNSILSVRATIR